MKPFKQAEYMAANRFTLHHNRPLLGAESLRHSTKPCAVASELLLLHT